MNYTVIYGASDDLVEFGGEIDEEVNSETVSFSASDGTKGRICYGGDGNWQITIKERGTLINRLVFAVGDDREHTDDIAKKYTSYSDILIWNTGLEWLKVKGKMYYAKKSI